MSATLSGLMALENPTPLEDSSSTVFFDGQMWLGPQQILTSIFHYYNLSNIAFANIRQYFLWIHVYLFTFSSHTLILHNAQVAKFDMTLNTQDGKHSSSHEDETYDQSKEQLKDDVTQSDGSSQTLQHNDDIIHIVGDIIHVCLYIPSVSLHLHIIIHNSLFQQTFMIYENGLTLTFPAQLSIRTKPAASSKLTRHSTLHISNTITPSLFSLSMLTLTRTSTKQRNRSQQIIHMFPSKVSWNPSKPTPQDTPPLFMYLWTTSTSSAEQPFHPQLLQIRVSLPTHYYSQFSFLSYSTHHPLTFFPFQIRFQHHVPGLIY